VVVVIDAGPARAAAFVRQRGLERLLEEVRLRYWRNGRAAGIVELADLSDAEHSGLAALDGRPADHGPLRLRLADLDARLRRSSFRCSLADLLTAYYGAPIRSRRHEREAAAEEARQHRDRWRGTFAAIVEDLAVNAAGRQWLDAGPHGIAWLTRRYAREPAAKLPERQALVRGVAAALSVLPLEQPRRLAVFANDLTGNPHALDSAEEMGRLFLAGLLDLHGAEVSLTGSPPERLAAAERRLLYANVGILAETISPTVAAHNLVGARRLNGSADPFVSGQNPALQVLPLRRLLEWSSARAAAPDVFVVENPVVFEDLLDQLEPAAATGQPVPTLICTAGWPSDAGWRLLDLLQRGDESVRFRYSGDFDLAGLRIAAAVQKRFPTRFRPWHLSAADYRQADRDGGIPASPEDLAQLAGLESLFPDLVAAMQETGRWAYQEAITRLLLGDLL